MTDPTLRFSSRVENYVRYRPRYPQQVIETLQQECDLTASCLVADIGSGTGALTELFLNNGNRVSAVEPNREMREAAERIYGKNPSFRSVEGRAEQTNLDSSDADFIVVGQAFHWFEVAEARREFLRVLKPSGWSMVVWNERDFESTPFLAGYDQLLKRYAPDYAREKHKQVYDSELEEFFGRGGYVEKNFRFYQELDFDGVRGRMQSSSYTPELGHPHYERMVAELSRLFHAHEVHGRVTFEYITRMYYGRLSD
jgi:SAM-dependent methyltransferase